MINDQLYQILLLGQVRHGLKIEHWLNLNLRRERLGIDILSATNIEKMVLLKPHLAAQVQAKSGWWIEFNLVLVSLLYILHP